MKKKKKRDYQAMFTFGIILVGVGVVFLASVNKTLGAAFLFIGGMYMIIGGKNKDKWKKK